MAALSSLWASGFAALLLSGWPPLFFSRAGSACAPGAAGRGRAAGGPGGGAPGSARARPRGKKGEGKRGGRCVREEGRCRGAAGRGRATRAHKHPGRVSSGPCSLFLFCLLVFVSVRGGRGCYVNPAESVPRVVRITRWRVKEAEKKKKERTGRTRGVGGMVVRVCEGEIKG